MVTQLHRRCRRYAMLHFAADILVTILDVITFRDCWATVTATTVGEAVVDYVFILGEFLIVNINIYICWFSSCVLARTTHRGRWSSLGVPARSNDRCLIQINCIINIITDLAAVINKV